MAGNIKLLLVLHRVLTHPQVWVAINGNQYTCHVELVFKLCEAQQHLKQKIAGAYKENRSSLPGFNARSSSLCFFYLVHNLPVNFFVLLDPERSVCSAVFQPLLHPLCNRTCSLFVSGKPCPQQNCMIGFVFIASKEADCCLLIGNSTVRVSHCRLETTCIAFLAKKTGNVESHSQVRVNCKLVYSLFVFFFVFSGVFCMSTT